MFLSKFIGDKLYYLKIILFVLLIFSFSLSMAFVASEEKLFIDAVSDNGKKIVIIDAGHGGEDCGAIGVNGSYEKDLNLQVSFKLGEYLENAGYTVVYTRTEDKLLYTAEQNIKGFRKIYDLKNRLKIAEQYPEALFISIHMNSFGEDKYSGLQVYYSVNNTESEEIAGSVQSEVKNRIQPENNRMAKKGKDIYLLENASNNAILIECGFLTNEEECKKLCEKEYQKELSFAIMCGIISYENKSGN